MTEIPAQFSRIYRTDSWLMSLSDFSDDDAGILAKVREFFTEERFSVKDVQLSYRLVNTWSKAGILKDRREHDGEWRRLTFVDLVWITIVAELRKFGVSIEQLQKSYDTAYFCMGNKGKPWDLLPFGIAQCLQRREQNIVVFNDGWLEIATSKELEFTEQLYGNLGGYIKINLNGIVRKRFPKFPSEIQASFSSASSLTPKEQAVVDALRDGNLVNLNIHFKDGEVTRLDKITRNGDDAEAIKGIIEKIEYGSLLVQVQDGKIVLAERLEKEKV